MKRITAALALTLVCAPVGLGQYRDLMGSVNARPSSSSSKVTLTGYLADKRCVTARTDSLRTFGPSHATACMVTATGQGLGVVSKGTWYPFDEKSAKKAVEVLKNAKTDSGLIVSVTGNMKGDLFVVATIKEIRP